MICVMLCYVMCCYENPFKMAGIVLPIPAPRQEWSIINIMCVITYSLCVCCLCVVCVCYVMCVVMKNLKL